MKLNRKQKDNTHIFQKTLDSVSEESTPEKEESDDLDIDRLIRHIQIINRALRRVYKTRVPRKAI